MVWTRFLIFAGMLALLASFPSSGQAHPFNESFLLPYQVSEEDLARGELTFEISGTPGGSLRLFPRAMTPEQAEARTCEVPLEATGSGNSKATIRDNGSAACLAVLRMAPADEFLGRVGDGEMRVVKLRKAPEWSKAAISKSGKVDVPGFIADSPCSVRAGSWLACTPSEGKLNLSGANLTQVLAALKAGGSVILRVAPADGAGALRQVPLSLKAAGGTTASSLDENFCLEGGGPDGASGGATATGEAYYLLCVGLTDPLVPVRWLYDVGTTGAATALQSPRLRVNRDTHVYVGIPVGKDLTVDVSATGTAGLTLDPIRSESAGTGGGATHHHRVWVLPPRTPGAFSVTVKTEKVAKEKRSTLSEFKTEFLVLEEYVGAIRAGVALFYSPLHRSYAVSRIGNGSSEVVRDSALWGEAGFEIVVGYALWGRPRLLAEMRGGKPAFYFGLGLIAGSTEGLRPLSSAHLGIEWALGKDTSLALTASLRFGQRPAPGWEVGRAVADGVTEVRTQPMPLPGVGLIFNMSPDFMKVVKMGPGG